MGKKAIRAVEMATISSKIRMMTRIEIPAILNFLRQSVERGRFVPGLAERGEADGEKSGGHTYTEMRL